MWCVFSLETRGMSATNIEWLNLYLWGGCQGWQREALAEVILERWGLVVKFQQQSHRIRFSLDKLNVITSLLRERSETTWTFSSEEFTQSGKRRSNNKKMFTPTSFRYKPKIYEILWNSFGFEWRKPPNGFLNAENFHWQKLAMAKSCTNL